MPDFAFEVPHLAGKDTFGIDFPALELELLLVRVTEGRPAGQFCRTHYVDCELDDPLKVLFRRPM